MEFTKFEQISLKRHATLNERWVQERIAEDPSILGLGDLVMKDRERVQAKAGRLDLLLQDSESLRRYEVEIQLGATDESHIIRTIEYWDLERKRYPQYEHTAVIVAENITGRFLNVISLFNGNIPLVAIQMRALQLGSKVGLVFTTVVDLQTLGLVDEDEEVHEPTNRAYWETRSSKKALAVVDQLIDIAKQHDSALEPKYNKYYIGIARNGQFFNFMAIYPRKDFVDIEVQLPSQVELQEKLEAVGLIVSYDKRRSKYKLRSRTADFEKQKSAITPIIAEAYAEFDER